MNSSSTQAAEKLLFGLLSINFTALPPSGAAFFPPTHTFTLLFEKLPRMSLVLLKGSPCSEGRARFWARLWLACEAHSNNPDASRSHGNTDEADLKSFCLHSAPPSSLSKQPQIKSHKRGKTAADRKVAPALACSGWAGVSDRGVSSEEYSASKGRHQTPG